MFLVHTFFHLSFGWLTNCYYLIVHSLREVSTWESRHRFIHFEDALGSLDSHARMYGLPESDKSTGLECSDQLEN
jgi:hypothetical protein